MPAQPIHDESFPIRASILKELAVQAAIDRGCSLTKIVFVPKDASVDGDFVSLRCLTFSNDHFEDALETLKTSANLPKEGKLHVTGMGCEVFVPIISQVLGLEVLLVPEVLTLGTGVYLTLANTTEEAAFHLQAPHASWSLHEIKAIKERRAEMVGGTDDCDPNKPFPAGVVYVGSGSGILFVDEDGKFKLGAITGLSGMSFMGLANMVLGTCDYDEIMSLAAAGTRTNVDYVMRDITESQDLPNIGKFPSNLPVMSFGKATHTWWDEENVSRSDLAASLLYFFASNLWGDMRNVSVTMKIKRFYIVGNFARAEIFRSYLLEANTLFPPTLDIRFLTTGSTGAIGAMLLGDGDTIPKWSMQ